MMSTIWSRNKVLICTFLFALFISGFYLHTSDITKNPLSYSFFANIFFVLVLGLICIFIGFTVNYYTKKKSYLSVKEGSVSWRYFPGKERIINWEQIDSISLKRQSIIKSILASIDIYTIIAPFTLFRLLGDKHISINLKDSRKFLFIPQSLYNEKIKLIFNLNTELFKYRINTTSLAARKSHGL